MPSGADVNEGGGLFGGRYQRLSRIASGGMASVYLGRALAIGGFERVVAIKVMHPHLATDQEFVSMFLDEARLAARIRHPNVVATLDVQMSDDDVFLVMDYVDGPSLFGVFRSLRDRRQRLPVELTLRILLDALAGLHEAHELRDASGAELLLVHRDVSPHNVLVGADGIARIADFGIARAEERLSFTSGGKVKGKMTYMAPEQLSGGVVDRRADVYAAGVVLWECLAARRLFRGEHEAAVAAAILQERVPWPDEVEPSVPHAISEVCMRALERDPARRFPDAAAFSDALEHAARLSQLHVAGTRGLASFVSALGAHTPVAELLSRAGSAPALESAPRASSALLPRVDEPPPAPPQLPPQPLELGSSTAIASAAPSRTDLRPAPEGHRASRALWVLAFAVGALAMGVVLLASRIGGSLSAGPSAQRGEARAPAPTSVIVAAPSPSPAVVEPPPSMRVRSKEPRSAPTPEPPAPLVPSLQSLPSFQSLQSPVPATSKGEPKPPAPTARPTAQPAATNYRPSEP